MKRPICNEEMTFDKGAWFCKNDKTDVSKKDNEYHQVVVLCNCGRRMIPKGHYHDGIWSFWKCPHCFCRR